MNEDSTKPPFSLKRWSRRKLESSRAARPTAPSTAPAAPSAPAFEAPVAARADARADAGTADVATPELPPVESLTFESDFVPYMQPKVGEAVKRQALKKLFRDPRFNVMDGLDVYIDDYTIPSPIEPAMVEQLAQARYLFDPPKTRVNAQGWVEDEPGPESTASAASVTAEEATPQLDDADPRSAREPAPSLAAADAAAGRSADSSSNAAQDGAGDRDRDRGADAPGTSS